MATVAKADEDAELHLLTEWEEPGARSRGRKAAILSVAAHAALITTLALLPPEVLKPLEDTVRRVTPLIEPPTELTQRAPNTSKPEKEFRAEVRPRLQLPAGPPPTPAPAQKQIAAPPPPPPKPAPTIPDAPAVAANKEAPKPDLPVLPPAPAPPQIQPSEKQSPFDNPTPVPANPTRRAPEFSVQEAIRQTMRQGGGSGRTLIPGEPDGAGQALPGSAGELPQLLSDPMGVDFRPYLTQILTIVRRNWFAVMPESVRLGMTGKVAVQFAVAKSGAVTKVVYASQSGNRALDQAAVTAISMSNPFPALPGNFRGDRIVLQFNFAYNVKK